MMAFLQRKLRRWVTPVCLLVVLFFVLAPIRHAFNEYLISQNLQLLEYHTRLTNSLSQFQQDAATARKISKNITPDQVHKLLAPMDKNVMSQMIEPMAASVGLANISYELSPPKNWDGGKNFFGIEGIEKRSLSVETDAPHDGMVFSFLSEMQTMTGRLELDSFSLSRIGADPATTPISRLNLHMKATYSWYLNAPEQGEMP